MFDLFPPHAITLKHFPIAAFGNILEMVPGIVNRAPSMSQKMQGACSRYLLLKGILTHQLSSALLRKAELHMQLAHNSTGSPQATENTCKSSSLPTLAHRVSSAASAIHLLCMLSSKASCTLSQTLRSIHTFCFTFF